MFRKGNGYYFRNGQKINLDNYKLLPNVKTRNVCQDAYFQTHTYIAGPSEIKYIHDLDPLYKRHGIRKAGVKLRMSIDLIEPRTRHLLNKCSLKIGDIVSMPKDKLISLISSRLTGIDFNRLKKDVIAETESYVQFLNELQLDVSKIRKYLIKEVKQVLGKKRAEEKKKIMDHIRIGEELSDRLLPFGKKQERVFNLFCFMNLYGGLDFITWLHDHYSFDIAELEITFD